MLPNAEIQLRGGAVDPDGKSPLVFRWVLRQGATETTLGEATTVNRGRTAIPFTPSDHVQGNCGGVEIEIILYATDADGQEGSSKVTVAVIYEPC